MKTKSRYEVIAELEENKRNLIRQRDGLNDLLKAQKKEIKELKRELEDKEEEVGEFEKSIDEKKQTFQTLIDSIDESLKRFSDLDQK